MYPPAPPSPQQKYRIDHRAYDSGIPDSLAQATIVWACYARPAKPQFHEVGAPVSLPRQQVGPFVKRTDFVGGAPFGRLAEYMSYEPLYYILCQRLIYELGTLADSMEGSERLYNLVIFNYSP